MELKLSEWLSDLAHSLSTGAKPHFVTMCNNLRNRAVEAEKLEAAAEVITRLDEAVSQRKQTLREKGSERPTTKRIVEVLEYVRHG